MKLEGLSQITIEQKDKDIKSLPLEGNNVLNYKNKNFTEIPLSEEELKTTYHTKKTKKYLSRIPLSEEELKMSNIDLAKKYGLDYHIARIARENKYRSVRNPDFVSKKSIQQETKKEAIDLLEQVTQVNIASIETAIGNQKEQEEIKKIVGIYDKYKYYTQYIGNEKINSKKFRLLNGQELSFGDFVILNRMIDLKMFRNNDGVLMMFDETKNDFVKFRQSDLLSRSNSSSVIFKSNVNEDKKKGKQSRIIKSIESFAPAIFKLGFFKEEDFGKRNAGTSTYDTFGPHERTISKSKPNVALSNSVNRCAYYIGREKFVGTNKEINHETVRVSILDDNTGVITDVVNGRKMILYTFPLITKEWYEKKKDEIIKNRLLQNKNIDKKIIGDSMTKKASLKDYSILDYVHKKNNESDVEYLERISRLSDTSYVLGSFKKFMSEAGLAANNFSWKEQLLLADVLTKVDQRNKINSFGKNFGKNGIRTFLSIEQGEDKMGDKIIGLGETLPEDIAKKVFAKYGEIIDNVSKITEFTRTNFNKEIDAKPELIKKIEEILYIKGEQLLSKIYDDVNSKKEINYEGIEKQLDRINADTITTFAIFKQAVKNGEKLPIESIEGSVFSKKEAVDISDNQQNEMLELYESNWKNHRDRNFVESLKSYFKTAFVPEDNKKKNYFYTFEKDNNIRAFVRFEKQNDASFYASALNVDEASKNFGLGEAMMDEALTREAKEHILHASCRKDNPSNMRYFEKGFISRGFKKTNETEEFDLVWDENKNKDIKAKQKSQEELISIYSNTDIGEIEIKKSKDLESLHENIPEGKSLVRCFINNGEWYAVYELIKDDYGMNLGETK